MTDNILARFSANLILGVSWIVACQQVFYANELPGDGFTAGILILVALMLEYSILGHGKASVKLPDRIFHYLLAGGAALLWLLMFIPLLLLPEGKLLQSFKIPFFGTEFSSTLFFDLAIFMMVGGGALTYLVSSKETEP